jgi:hypothetical protein
MRDVFVLAGRAVGAPAGAEFDLALVEVFVELGQFLAGGLAVLLDRSELAAVVEEGDIVADDVLVEDDLWRRQISQLSECLGLVVNGPWDFRISGSVVVVVESSDCCDVLLGHVQDRSDLLDENRMRVQASAAKHVNGRHRPNGLLPHVPD